MEQNAYTYIQITAATRRVIESQSAQWQSVFEQDPNNARPGTFRDAAMGAYLVWAELNNSQYLENDRTVLLEMVQRISKPA